MHEPDPTFARLLNGSVTLADYSKQIKEANKGRKGMRKIDLEVTVKSVVVKRIAIPEVTLHSGSEAGLCVLDEDMMDTLCDLKHGESVMCENCAFSAGNFEAFLAAAKDAL